jgi:hypothetical protein
VLPIDALDDGQDLRNGSTEAPLMLLVLNSSELIGWDELEAKVCHRTCLFSSRLTHDSGHCPCWTPGEASKQISPFFDTTESNNVFTQRRGLTTTTVTSVLFDIASATCLLEYFTE